VIRADLLALTPEALVRLANVGLVRRAQKEQDAGIEPRLTEEADGAVLAESKDGARVRLSPGVTLQSASCTCGASPVCRHRIAAVLAYQKRHAALKIDAAGSVFDPGAFSDEALLQCCGAPSVALADALLARGLVITTSRDGLVPAARLPTATVQFLVPDEVAYAKCDCAKGAGCEHVVLAVRAFRARPEGGVILLAGGAPGAATATAASADSETRRTVEAALAHLLDFGLDGAGTRDTLVNARGAAERAGWQWIIDGIESLERAADAYQRQSASFRAETVFLEIGEITARIRAAHSSAPKLSAHWLLGSDVAAETRMEQVRLISLGVRTGADDDRRMVRLYFADPDTGTVLVLDKTWPGETRNGHELGQLFASSRLSVASLALGEVVARGARRRPNGALDLGAARGMKGAVLPSRGIWTELPGSLRITDLGDLTARRRHLPPLCLSPRSLGSGVAIVALGEVEEIDAPADGQAVTGFVSDPAGTRLLVHTEHRQVSPGAVEATLRALQSGATHVAGELRRTRDGWFMSPTSFLGADGQLVVVDLERPAPRAKPAAAADAHVAPADTDPVQRFERQLHEYLARSALKGMARTTASATELAAQAERLFLPRLARSLQASAAGAKDAWLDLAVLTQMDA
jgi:hypothetical protein